MFLDAASLATLREQLLAADFTYHGVAALLGEGAQAALLRNETTPGLRRTGDGSPLATMTRLWPLQAAVSYRDAERAFPGLLDRLCNAGVLEASVSTVRARMDVRPYADDERDFWVVSDLTPGLDGAGNRVARDHVLGISSASTSLAQLTIREPVESALDLGTGCGVQSLHLSHHADRVVATDVNRRALAMAQMNAVLNQAPYQVREGSLYEPVAHELFDLIVTNPPFVVSPGTGELLVYRDSGLPGDEVVRRVVTGAPSRLKDGGWCQILANWVHTEDQPWQERISTWLEPTGCDAWVVQREVADPASYVELWLRDAGHDRSPDYLARYDAWLGWLEAQGITGIGFGWINLHRTGGSHHLIEEWPYEVEQPLGPEVLAWSQRRQGLTHSRADAEPQLDPADLAGRRLRRRADVVEERRGEPGAEHPETIVLRQQRGLRRARQVDTIEAALIGACDGDLTVGQILTALSTLVPDLSIEAHAEYLAACVELVEQGFLEPL